MSGKRAGRAVAAVHLGLFIVALGIDVGLIVMSGKLLSQWKLLGCESEANADPSGRDTTILHGHV